VIMTDIDDEGGRAAAEELGAEYLHLDVREEADWRAVFQLIEARYERLDILVNNAGIDGFTRPRGPRTRSTSILKAGGTCTPQTPTAWPSMQVRHRPHEEAAKREHHQYLFQGRHRGHPHGRRLRGEQGLGEKSHQKRGSLLRPEWLQYPLQLHPSRRHPHEMWDPMLGEGKRRERLLAKMCSQVPLGHMGDPMDVANAALYLASDEAAYVTASN